MSDSPGPVRYAAPTRLPNRRSWPCGLVIATLGYAVGVVVLFVSLSCGSDEGQSRHEQILRASPGVDLDVEGATRVSSLYAGGSDGPVAAGRVLPKLSTTYRLRSDDPETLRDELVVAFASDGHRLAAVRCDSPTEAVASLGYDTQGHHVKARLRVDASEASVWATISDEEGIASDRPEAEEIDVDPRCSDALRDALLGVP